MAFDSGIGDWLSFLYGGGTGGHGLGGAFEPLLGSTMIPPALTPGMSTPGMDPFTAAAVPPGDPIATAPAMGAATQPVALTPPPPRTSPILHPPSSPGGGGYAGFEPSGLPSPSAGREDPALVGTPAQRRPRPYEPVQESIGASAGVPPQDIRPAAAGGTAGGGDDQKKNEMASKRIQDILKVIQAGAGSVQRPAVQAPIPQGVPAARGPAVTPAAVDILKFLGGASPGLASLLQRPTTLGGAVGIGRY